MMDHLHLKVEEVKRRIGQSTLNLFDNKDPAVGIQYVVAAKLKSLTKKFKNGKCSLKSLIPNYGTKKYLNVKAEKVELNLDKIEVDEQWDGLHGVITNVSEEKAQSLLARYSGLWQIEAAFRVNKHDLKMRPIHHWTPERIEAHISICFIAYTLAKQALYRLKVQQKEVWSFERLRNELLHVQATICRDLQTQRMYKIPSKVTVLHEKIYRAFGLRRSDGPRLYRAGRAE
jgi:transposase